MNKRLHWLVLLLVGIVISIGMTQSEFFFFGDEMRHAMTGVFFRDLLVDHPWSNPVQYAYEYYAKYPALGLLYWPPLFHMVEGLFFLLFGINVVASRLTLLAYSLMGVYFWYKIAEREGPQPRALASAFIFPLLPFVLQYERVTMLEIPCVAMCLASLYFWQGFMREERARDLWWFAALLAAAFLTSQKAIFLVFFVVLHFLVEWRWKLLKRWDVWAAGLLSAVVVVPWYLFMLGKLSLSYERVSGQAFHHAATLYHLTFYVERVILQTGILVGVLGMAGFVWALLRARKEHRFFLVWIVATYVCFTLIQEKSTRHTLVWIPVLVYFTLVMVENLQPRKSWIVPVFSVLAVYALVKALNTDSAKTSGIEPIARFVMAQPESDVVYYQGFLNGNFIFFVRKYDPQKRSLVAREKQVVATKINVGYGTRRILNTPEEVIRMFQQWGIRYAVVENREFIGGLSPVRVALQSDQFEVVQRYSIHSNQAFFKNRRVTIFRYKGELKRSEATVTLPMMTLREDIKADLNRLAGRPWPN
ncbi:MAG: glycosyltransferase family 39 protein [Acidobacteria bacterium]|nr:glycosyltransferase family 39 protein [Acidobacteriota bacterium]MCL5289269.1 glycosyltransferase family 39 protein [Acidobacteriota bacterium]